MPVLVLQALDHRRIEGGQRAQCAGQIARYLAIPWQRRAGIEYPVEQRHQGFAVRAVTSLLDWTACAGTNELDRHTGRLERPSVPGPVLGPPEGAAAQTVRFDPQLEAVRAVSHVPIVFVPAGRANAVVRQQFDPTFIGGDPDEAELPAARKICFQSPSLVGARWRIKYPAVPQCSELVEERPTLPFQPEAVDPRIIAFENPFGAVPVLKQHGAVWVALAQGRFQQLGPMSDQMIGLRKHQPGDQEGV